MLLEREISELKIKQNALKILNNSGYGSIGNAYFRYFNIKNAEAITLTGQYISQHIGNVIDKYLNSILKTNKPTRLAYGDTDSCAICLEDIFTLCPKEQQKLFNENINERIDFLDFFAKTKIKPKIDQAIKEIETQLNSFPKILSMKREAIADKIIVTGKKHYIMNVFDSEGVRLSSPYKKIVGIESVRSSTPPLCRNLIKNTIDYFFTHDNDFLIKVIADSKKQLSETKDLSSICFPRGVQGLTKYYDEKSLYTKGTPLQVRGALVFNQWIKKNNLQYKYTPIQEGDKIKFAYLKLPNPFHENVIAWSSPEPPVEIQLEKFIDLDQHFQIGYLNSIQKITEAISWSITKIESCDDWF